MGKHDAGPNGQGAADKMEIRQRAATLAAMRDKTAALAAENGDAIQELLRMGVSPNLVALKLDLLVDGMFPPGTEQRVLWDHNWEQAANRRLTKAVADRRRSILTEGVHSVPPPRRQG